MASTSLVSRMDSWLSALTGLGTRRDKLESVRFERETDLDDDTCEGLFDQDDIACKIASAGPAHMFRRGFEVETGDPTSKDRTKDEIERLEVLAAFVEALTWENVFGGSAILVGVYDGLPMDQPLDLGSAQRIYFLTVLDKRDLIPREYFTDPFAADFGKPKVYEILSTPRITIGSTGATMVDAWSKGSKRVHASRLIVFPGPLTSKRTRRTRQSWGTSKISRTYRAQRLFGVNWQSVSHLMQDASQGVFRVKNLIAMIGGGKKAELQTRMEYVDMARSVARALLLDADQESFERNDTTFAGLPDLLDRSAQRLASAADMPVSILMGREPAGLNATGELDVRAWYDTLEADRTLRVLPRLRQLLRILFATKQGPTGGVVPDTWEITFPPLWQPLPKEEADLGLVEAQTKQIYVTAGVLTPESVALQVFGDDPVVQAETALAMQSTPAPAPVAPPALPESTPSTPAPEGTAPVSPTAA